MEKLVTERYSPQAKRYGCGNFVAAKCPVRSSLEIDTRQQVARIASNVKDQLQRLDEVPYGPAVAETLLMDYIERIATFAVGPERSCALLKCIALDSSWGDLFA